MVGGSKGGVALVTTRSGSRRLPTLNLRDLKSDREYPSTRASDLKG